MVENGAAAGDQLRRMVGGDDRRLRDGASFGQPPNLLAGQRGMAVRLERACRDADEAHPFAVEAETVGAERAEKTAVAFRTFGVVVARGQIEGFAEPGEQAPGLAVPLRGAVVRDVAQQQNEAHRVVGVDRPDRGFQVFGRMLPADVRVGHHGEPQALGLGGKCCAEQEQQDRQSFHGRCGFVAKVAIVSLPGCSDFIKN